MGHRHDHGHGERGEHFDEHFERRWERGPRGFRGFGPPPPWAFRGPDPRWFGYAPPWMYGGPRGWRAEEERGPRTREERVAMLEEHQRRLQRRLAQVSEELERLRRAGSGQGGPGTTV